MIKKISQSANIIESLKDGGKIKTVDPTNFSKTTEELARKMEEVRREYKQKESASQKSAAIFALTS